MQTPLASAPPARVYAVPTRKESPDVTATMLLLQVYTDEKGFHCPKCGIIIPAMEQAVEHMAKEINTGLDSLAKLRK